ncbi:MAG TPA: GGDEF domain-containing protein [Dehalococcoidia bacterium]|jgi:diguanylate cyclase (GGDEF)-like protein|nr:GGDEF domain-containing protein [Dehalococcoidia bacterium]
MAPVNLAGLLQRIVGSSEGTPVPLSQIDPLTRLPMRAAVVEELRRCLAKAHHKRPVALAIVDFSNVQGMVETAAAGEGDLLMRLSKLMRSHVPEEHFIGHLREREFAVILCGTPIAEVEHLADSIIESVRSDSSVQADRRYIATVVGIGYSSKGDAKGPQLMGLADIALHYALATGRGSHTIVDRVPPAKAA